MCGGSLAPYINLSEQVTETELFEFDFEFFEFDIELLAFAIEAYQFKTDPFEIPNELGRF